MILSVLSEFFKLFLFKYLVETPTKQYIFKEKENLFHPSAGVYKCEIQQSINLHIFIFHPRICSSLKSHDFLILCLRKFKQRSIFINRFLRISMWIEKFFDQIVKQKGLSKRATSFKKLASYQTSAHSGVCSGCLKLDSESDQKGK